MFIDLLKSLTKQSNLILPLGKGRMGLEVRWGLMSLAEEVFDKAEYLSLPYGGG